MSPLFQKRCDMKIYMKYTHISFSRQKVPIFDEEKKRYIYLIHVFILPSF